MGLRKSGLVGAGSSVPVRARSCLRACSSAASSVPCFHLGLHRMKRRFIPRGGERSDGICTGLRGQIQSSGVRLSKAAVTPLHV